VTFSPEALPLGIIDDHGFAARRLHPAQSLDLRGLTRSRAMGSLVRGQPPTFPSTGRATNPIRMT
jgi:hypothetical protein